MKTVFEIGGGFTQYIQRLDRLQNNAEALIEKAIYPGAGLMADEIRRAIENLPIIDREVRETGSAKLGTKSVQNDTDNRKVKTVKGAPKGITKIEREGLLDTAKKTGMGLAPIREEAGKKGGYINTKVGMNGYNKHVTARYPKGHPNAMVARSIESGTSFRRKCPFIAPTVRKYKDQVEQLIAKEFDRLADKI